MVNGDNREIMDEPRNDHQQEVPPSGVAEESIPSITTTTTPSAPLAETTTTTMATTNDASSFTPSTTQNENNNKTNYTSNTTGITSRKRIAAIAATAAISEQINPRSFMPVIRRPTVPKAPAAPTTTTTAKMLPPTVNNSTKPTTNTTKKRKRNSSLGAVDSKQHNQQTKGGRQVPGEQSSRQLSSSTIRNRRRTVSPSPATSSSNIEKGNVKEAPSKIVSSSKVTPPPLTSSSTSLEKKVPNKSTSNLTMTQPKSSLPRTNSTNKKSPPARSAIDANSTTARRSSSRRQDYGLMELATAIVNKKNVLLITGAGLSVDSGIRPFRSNPVKTGAIEPHLRKYYGNYDYVTTKTLSNGVSQQMITTTVPTHVHSKKINSKHYLEKGLWNDVIWTTATREAFCKDPEKWYNDFWVPYFCAGGPYYPNLGHTILVSLMEQFPKSIYHITQNIDGLLKLKPPTNVETEEGDEDEENDSTNRDIRRRKPKPTDPDYQHPRSIEVHGRCGLFKCCPTTSDEESSSDDDDNNNNNEADDDDNNDGTKKKKGVFEDKSDKKPKAVDGKKLLSKTPENTKQEDINDQEADNENEDDDDDADDDDMNRLVHLGHRRSGRKKREQLQDPSRCPYQYLKSLTAEEVDFKLIYPTDYRQQPTTNLDCITTTDGDTNKSETTSVYEDEVNEAGSDEEKASNKKQRLSKNSKSIRKNISNKNNKQKTPDSKGTANGKKRHSQSKKNNRADDKNNEGVTELTSSSNTNNKSATKKVKTSEKEKNENKGAKSNPTASTPSTATNTSVPTPNSIKKPVIAKVPKCPFCGNLAMPQALLFDEGYHSHSFYNSELCEEWISKAEVIVFIGTSFAVRLTQVALKHARDHAVPVFNFNLQHDLLESSIRLNATNIVGPVSTTLPKLFNMVQDLELERILQQEQTDNEKTDLYQEYIEYALEEYTRYKSYLEEQQKLGRIEQEQLELEERVRIELEAQEKQEREAREQRQQQMQHQLQQQQQEQQRVLQQLQPPIYTHERLQRDFQIRPNNFTSGANDIAMWLKHHQQHSIQNNNLQNRNMNSNSQKEMLQQLLFLQHQQNCQVAAMTTKSHNNGIHAAAIPQRVVPTGVMMSNNNTNNNNKQQQQQQEQQQQQHHALQMFKMHEQQLYSRTAQPSWFYGKST